MVIGEVIVSKAVQITRSDRGLIVIGKHGQQHISYMQEGSIDMAGNIIRVKGGSKAVKEWLRRLVISIRGIEEGIEEVIMLKGIGVRYKYEGNVLYIKAGTSDSKRIDISKIPVLIEPRDNSIVIRGNSKHEVTRLAGRIVLISRLHRGRGLYRE